MYEFSPTPEQERVLERVRRSWTSWSIPNESQSIPHRGLPRDLLRQLQARVKAEGLWAAHLPADAGGLGMGNVTLGLINEQLGRSPIAPRVFGTSAPDTGNTEILWLAGTPEQKRKYLEPLVADEVRSCIAMTEPEVSGSDPTQIRSTAPCSTATSGSSTATSGSSPTPTARRSPSSSRSPTPTPPPHRRASMFIVATDTPGLRVRPRSAGDGRHERGRPLRAAVRRRAASRPTTCWASAGGGFALAQARLGPGRITTACAGSAWPSARSS